MLRPALVASLISSFLAAGCGPRPGSNRPATGGGFAVAFDAGAHARAADVAIAGDRIAVAGSFAGQLSLGPHSVTAAGGGDGFVALLDARGRIRWLRGVSGPGLQEATATAVTPAGRVLVAGSFEQSATLGAGRTRGAGRPAAFVAAIDEAGKSAWTVALASDEHVRLSDLLVLADGSAVVVGQFAGTVQIGERRLASAGAQDALLIRVGADGSLLWARRAGGRGADQAHAVAAAGDTLFVAGSFAGTADFAGAVLESNRHQDGFLAAVTPGGDVQWVNTFGGSKRDLALAVAANADQVLVAGIFQGSDANFGTGELSTGSAITGAFAASYDHTGQPRWSQRIGDGTADARALTTSGDQFVLAGTFTGDQTFGSRSHRSRGHRDLFVVTLSPDGTIVDSTAFGGPSHDDLSSVAASATLPPIVAGTFTGSLDLAAHSLHATGTSSGFVSGL